MRRSCIVVMIGIGIVALAVFLGYLAISPSIRVTAQNTGHDALGNVSIHVTGNTYFLGDVKAGEAATCIVSPRSESHIEIEFTARDGQQLRLDAGGYFEPGYRGSFEVRIDGKNIVSVTDDVRIGLY